MFGGRVKIMGQTLPPPRGRGGCQGAGRICEQERGEYPIYIVGGEGGGTGERPPQTDHDDQTERGRGGSHIPVLFSRCSLIVIATAEREGKGYLSNPGEGRCLCCLREQQGEEDLAASRAFWGGGRRGGPNGPWTTPQTQQRSRWLADSRGIHQRNQMRRHQRKEKVLLVGFKFLGPFP